MRKKDFHVIAFLMFLLTGSLLPAEEYMLVDNGKCNANIQLDQLPDVQEIFAGNELRDIVKKITGVNLGFTAFPAIFFKRKAMNPSYVGIIIGSADKNRLLLPETIKKKFDSTKNPHAFHLGSKVIDGMKYIFITGKTAQGALYGTYAFLEDYLDVRFFHAGEEGLVLPSTKTIVVGDLDDFREPWLHKRLINCWVGSVAPWSMADFNLWQLRRGYVRKRVPDYEQGDAKKIIFELSQGTYVERGGHVTHLDAIPASLFKKHPEYFPMIDGKRSCPEGYQTCLTNPEVRKLILDYALGFVRSGMGYQFGYADNMKTWCSCPECIRYGTDSKGVFSISNLAHRFTSDMSNQLLARCPGAKLSYTMYSQYRDVPTLDNFRYDKRILGVYCPHQRCYAHPFNAETECNRDIFLKMKEWVAMGTPVGIFDYYSYAYAPYNPLEYTLAKDMKTYRDMKIEYWLEDCSNRRLPIPLSNWQFYYAASKLMWNADLDIEKLMEDAYDKYYGKAAGPMKKYHHLRRELFESSIGHVVYPDVGKHMWCLTVPGAEKRLLNWLNEADALAGNDRMLRKRIGNDRNFLTKYWIADAKKLKIAQDSQKSIPACRRVTPIKIDGKLDEEIWISTPIVTGFVTTGKKNPAIEDTSVKVLYDNDAWYIGIDAKTEHAWSPLRAKVTARDKEVWEDDHMEITIAPPGGSNYFHYIVNSIGTLYDAKGRDPSYDFQGELKTTVSKDRYTVEMRIPVAAMGEAPIRAGKAWKMNFFRYCSNLQPPVSTQGVSIDGIEPHDYTLARPVTMGRSVLRNHDFSMLKDTPKGVKIFSKKWLARWGASQARLIEGKKNKIEIMDVAYTDMDLPRLPKPMKISGSIVVSGKGVLNIYARGICATKEKPDARGYDPKQTVEIAKIQLTEKPVEYPLSFTLGPYAWYTLDLRTEWGGKSVVEYINLTR